MLSSKSVLFVTSNIIDDNETKNYKKFGISKNFGEKKLNKFISQKLLK